MERSSTGWRRRQWLPFATREEPFSIEPPASPISQLADECCFRRRASFLRRPLPRAGHCDRPSRRAASATQGMPYPGPCRSAVTAPQPTSDDVADCGKTTPCSAPGTERCQARASLAGGGPAAAIVVTRMNAVAPTAIAPMIEKTTCHASEGIVCFTMPWVA